MGINVVLALMVIGSFLVAIPLHESGHALMASILGDRTPREEGRLSLSLRSHIDPIGTLMCVLLAFQPILGVGFGWGKPVKADPWKMRVGANAGVLLVPGNLRLAPIAMIPGNKLLTCHRVKPTLRRQFTYIHWKIRRRHDRGYKLLNTSLLQRWSEEINMGTVIKEGYEEG